jgi:hypothetical protein
MRKLLYDSDFQRTIIDNYGKAQMDEMKHWLNDFANRRNVDSAGQKAMDDVLGSLRGNIISNLIGLNPGTFFKHTPTALLNSMRQVGPLNFAKATFDLFRTDPVTQTRLMWTAYQESKELQGRIHNYHDLLRGQGESFQFEQGTYEWLREINMKIGAAPVSFGDFVSTVPTYWAARNAALEKGLSHAEAIQMGDAAVREAHGTSRLTGQPGVMRTNQLGRMYTSLYGFFSHILQQQYKLAWKASDLLHGQKPLDIEGYALPHMLGRFMTYFIIPAVIEELVTPYTNEEKDSWGLKAVKSLGLGLSGSLPYVRDFIRTVINPLHPSEGLLGTAFQFPARVVEDLGKRGPLNKEHAAQLLQDTTALIGNLGVLNAQAGRSAAYAYRVASGVEKPKGISNVLSGLWHGKTQKH